MDHDGSPDELAGTSALLAEAIARIWLDAPPPEIEGLNEELLKCLRELEFAIPAEQPAVRAEIRSLLNSVPAISRRVDDQLESLRTSVSGTGTAVDVVKEVRHHRHVRIEVVYGTTRRATGQSDPRNSFCGKRGEPSYGIAAVQLPDDRRMCQLDGPRPWPMRFRSERRQHLSITAAQPDGGDDIAGVLSDAVHRAPEPDVMLFVHGYNVGFPAAVQRAAQIAFDLDFKGVPMLYSWPSTASVSGYVADGVAVEWSAPHFTDFLRKVLCTIGVRRVHVVAHSMGNRLLTEALVALAVAPPSPRPARLAEIVFAAPDVDAEVFRRRAEVFAGQAERFTLYASDKDRALRMSQRLARYPRAGQAGAGIVVVDGVDTIDATELDTDFMGHSYIGDHRSVLGDLFYLIHGGLEPDKRFGLRSVVAPAGVHWVFRPTANR
ncbi:alpha/beta hydrolase [Nocardia sp. XZ_19_385]|uniref:alpha/beta hydrolase n=1 Tax=Nocardia sp. XZ_19_385 TaxID=2769488 RepID=UPI001890A6E3|nr:alpha/beta hydrolase [Nocardia sp. XZ_19_385]